MIEAVRWLVILFFYSGLLGIIVSVYTIEHPMGAAATPAVPTSVLCIVLLATLYFAVYLAIWVLTSIEKFSGRTLRGGGKTSKAPGPRSSSPEPKPPATGPLGALVGLLLSDVRDSVAFCPMLSVLFLGVRLRAHQLAGSAGEPQGWCLTFMNLATCAVFLQALARADKLLAPPADPVKETPGTLAKVCQGIQYACLLMMYAAVVAVIVALFTMTRETAGRTSLPAIPVRRIL